MYIFKLNKEDYSSIDRKTIRKQGQPDPKREQVPTRLSGGSKPTPYKVGDKRRTPHPSAVPTPSPKGEGKGLGWFLLLGLCFLIGVIL